MKPRVLIVCNAFDDVTRQQRGITTDSPAASRKVFHLCQALRLAGLSPFVVSLGRGRAGGSAAYFRSSFRRVDGIPTFYAPFSLVPIFSECISLLGLLAFVFKSRKAPLRYAIFYNRLAAYLPTLVLTRVLGFRNFLDLEDGEVLTKGIAAKRWASGWLRWLFDTFCQGGALLACAALKGFTSVRPVLCYYGTAVGSQSPYRWNSDKVTVLMGGSLSPDTGAELLIDTIAKMRSEKPQWAQTLQFEVTGSGPYLESFRYLERAAGFPVVRVHGRTTDLQYREILARCDVGLALKLNGGPLANTTFPSKVIEFAASGLLVLTTDVSDVRAVLKQGAFYLEADDPASFMMLFEKIAMDREASQQCALMGMRQVHATCSPAQAGQAVAHFLSDRPS